MMTRDQVRGIQYLVNWALLDKHLHGYDKNFVAVVGSAAVAPNVADDIDLALIGDAEGFTTAVTNLSLLGAKSCFHKLLPAAIENYPNMKFEVWESTIGDLLSLPNKPTAVIFSLPNYEPMQYGRKVHLLMPKGGEELFKCVNSVLDTFDLSCHMWGRGKKYELIGHTYSTFPGEPIKFNHIWSEAKSFARKQEFTQRYQAVGEFLFGIKTINPWSKLTKAKVAYSYGDGDMKLPTVTPGPPLDPVVYSVSEVECDPF